MSVRWICDGCGAEAPVKPETAVADGFHYCTGCAPRVQEFLAGVEESRKRFLEMWGGELERIRGNYPELKAVPLPMQG